MNRGGRGRGGGLSTDERLRRAEARVASLEAMLRDRENASHRAIQDRNDLQQRYTGVREELDGTNREHSVIFSEMTRQYKTMQEDLVERVHALSLQNAELLEQIELANLHKKETKKQMAQQLAEKDKIIKDQKRRMDRMVLEFAEMLQTALEKIQEQIEDAAVRQQNFSNQEILDLDPKYAAILRDQFDLDFTT
jgi:hypothetical protein